MSQPIASDLSYEVAQFRRQHPELETGRLNATHQVLRTEPCVFDGFAADRPSIADGFQGESRRFDDLGEPTPLWHRHGKRQ